MIKFSNLVFSNSIIVLNITRPPGAQVYCAPVKATVNKSRKAAASAGFDQRVQFQIYVDVWVIENIKCNMVCHPRQRAGWGWMSNI